VDPTRRDFSSKLIGSVITFGLVETLWSRDLFADSAKPAIAAWLKELAEMSNDLRGQKLTDLEFQKKMEDLYARVDLKALAGLVKLDEIEAKKRLPDYGAASVGFDLGKVEGLPEVRFGRQIFGCKKGRSIVPHGHHNMCTGFIVLKGKWHGRHFDKLETLADHYVIRPTIDREFGPGELSTVSDHKDNIHWFEAKTDGAYIFNVHVDGYDKSMKGNATRLYLDPDGEKLTGERIKAAKMNSEQCHKKYG
jgi:hypothetical protein